MPIIRIGRRKIQSCSSWILVLLLYYGNILESYELKTYDQLSRLKATRSPAPEEVVLVAVDQGSLEAAGREGIHWPWPRQMYAPLVQFCQLAGARAVVFDILFTEPSSYGVEDDRLLAESLKENDQAFLPIFLSREKHPVQPWEKDLVLRIALPLKDQSGESIPSYTSLIPPIQSLTESARGLGNVAISPDLDGIYRRTPVIFRYREQWVPSLGLAVFNGGSDSGSVVLDKNSLHGKGMSVPLDSKQTVLLHYYNPERDFRRFSAFNVIQSFLALQEGRKPVYPPELFRGRIVLVGLTAAGLFDLKPTPVASVTPGTAVHATLIANLLHKDFQVRISRAAVLTWGLVLAVAMAVTVLLVSRLWQLALFALAYGGGLALAGHTHRFRIASAPVPRP